MKDLKNMDIIWWIFILCICKSFFIPDELLFVIGIGICGLYVLKNKKIVIPKIPGLNIYILYLFIMIVMGACRYSLHLVIRDTFYEFGNIIFIVLGYWICVKNKQEKSLWKTLVLANATISAIVIFSGMFSLRKGGFSFVNFRTYFGTEVYSISIIFALMIIYKFYLKKNIFTKRIDTIIWLLWTFQIIANFSRTAIINVIVVLLISIITLTYNKKITISILSKIIKLIIAGLVIVILVWKMVPKNISERFINKFEHTFSEINSKNEFNNAERIESNWRGYEITCAKEFWKNQKFFVKIFGKGNGTIIPIQYIPVQWKKTVTEQEGKNGVPNLHNAYYTLLCKGGIICIIFLFNFIIGNIIKGLKLCKSDSKEIVICGLFTLGLFIVLSINAYIIMQMFQKYIPLTWALLVGWTSAINNRKNNLENLVL